MASLTNFATAGGLAFLIGIMVLIVAGILAAVAAVMRQAKMIKVVGITVALGVTVLVSGVLIAALTPAPTAIVASVPGTTVNTVVNSANFVTGQIWTPSTNAVTVSLVYNSTGAKIFTAPTVGFTGSGTNAKEACGSSTACHGYVVIPMKLARTDSVNQTAGFTLTINGIPTLTSTGSNPTLYSPVGYTAASTTSGGVWKISWSAGSLNGINPSQNAPTVTSGVAANVVGVQAFNSYSTVLSIALGGNSSTSGTWGTLAQNFTTYATTVAVTGGAGSTPAAITINWILIGWTA